MVKSLITTESWPPVGWGVRVLMIQALLDREGIEPIGSNQAGAASNHLLVWIECIGVDAKVTGWVSPKRTAIGQIDDGIADVQVV